MGERFAKLNANADGELSARRDARGPQARVTSRCANVSVERFEAADANGDGRIDLAEARTAMPRLAEKFSTVDADNDGKVTADELQVASPPLSCGRSPPGAGPRIRLSVWHLNRIPKPGTRRAASR